MAWPIHGMSHSKPPLKSFRNKPIGSQDAAEGPPARRHVAVGLAVESAANPRIDQE